MRTQPFSVLLFDEVEKADKRILTILLHLIDEGRITDGHGRVIDASKCIVILTSNLGAEHLKMTSSPAAHDLVMESLRSYFLPEFLGRISLIVIFDPLSKKDLPKLTTQKIREVQRRVKENHGIKLGLTEKVRSFLTSQVDPSVYGVRPLKRLIEDNILNLVSDLILRDAIKHGDAIMLAMQQGKITARLERRSAVRAGRHVQDKMAITETKSTSKRKPALHSKH